MCRCRCTGTRGIYIHIYIYMLERPRLEFTANRETRPEVIPVPTYTYPPDFVLCAATSELPKLDDRLIIRRRRHRALLYIYSRGAHLPLNCAERFGAHAYFVRFALCICKWERERTDERYRYISSGMIRRKYKRIASMRSLSHSAFSSAGPGD